jgi:SRSO17 transposase
MDARQVQATGEHLMSFLQEFDDCFGREEPRQNLRRYVSGQLSNLLRKSIEPMALLQGVAPRTLQWFVSGARWQEYRMRDQTQWIVARDHAAPRAIGIIDETGNPKQGDQTAGVGRQWCGRTGKVDNCVVGVHWSYVAGDFQCLMDSQMYLSKDWLADRDRCRQGKVPDDVVFQTKPQIALEQVRRALQNGLRLWSWTFDENYGRSGGFLDGMESLGQSYVGEVPSDFVGWLRSPRVLVKPTPQEAHRTGRKYRYPRLARKALPACEVRDLARYSPVFTDQAWENFRIKDGEKGPLVWQVKAARFYRKQGEDQLPRAAHTLIVARNALDRTEIKYFLGNRPLGSPGGRLQELLTVAFSRPAVERCFELAKNELGMDHFEVRSWPGIHRHWFISQVSQLFCAREHHRLREKNDALGLPDRRTSSRGRLHLGPAAIPGQEPDRNPATHRQPDSLLSASQPAGQAVAQQNQASTIGQPGNRRGSTEAVYSGRFMNQVAL